MIPSEGAPGWAHHLDSAYIGRSGDLVRLQAPYVYLYSHSGGVFPEEYTL